MHADFARSYFLRWFSFASHTTDQAKEGILIMYGNQLCYRFFFVVTVIACRRRDRINPLLVEGDFIKEGAPGKMRTGICLVFAGK